jgi:acetyl-CoA synthetase
MTTTANLWHPRPEDLEGSNVVRLMRRHGIVSTGELRERAAHDPAWFYPAILDDLGVEWFNPYDRLLDQSKGLPWTDWFLGGRLNIVHNVLDRRLREDGGDRLAVIGEDESGTMTTLSYKDLDGRVTRLAGALAGLGVGVGDSVGFYLPMTADVVVALLACLKIGAVAVPVFAGFGPDALAARLMDAAARVVLTADATVRRGKIVALKATVDAACALAPGVRRVVVLKHTGQQVAWNGDRDVWWHELESGGPSSYPTAALDASDRSLILYTSGTTGRPKGAVHTHGGVQVVTAKEVGYHLDVRPGDVMFWLTDIGWMMGPWEILGTLFHGGTVVLLDGAPDRPSAGRLWGMVERHRITHLAVAPTVIRLLASHGDDDVRQYDLSSLRILGSTGEPWDETSYMWYFDNVGGGRCPVINISGGTELMGCLLAPLPTAPIKPCSLQGPALGMDVDVLDESGRSVRGEVGYLVCHNAAPNMTRGFLGDRQRYLNTYFSRFGERVWCHGDWALADGDGAWFITGRADDTLKIAGKRIGPGEVEAAAISHPAVREAAAVGVRDEVKGTRLVLVAIPAPGFSPTEELSDQLASHLAAHLGPSMRPSTIVWATALPVTRSGKIVRGLIGRVLAGEDPGSVASVANPEALEMLSNRAKGPNP